MSDLDWEVSPREVKRRLDAGERLHLVDVREPEEWQITRIAGAGHIPMRLIPAALPKLEELAEEAPLIVFCHHGVRSLQVVNWLRQQGVEASHSMAGGIEQWSREVDPAVPTY